MSNFYPIILDINLERKTLEFIVNFIIYERIFNRIKC